MEGKNEAPMKRATVWDLPDELVVSMFQWLDLRSLLQVSQRTFSIGSTTSERNTSPAWCVVVGGESPQMTSYGQLKFVNCANYTDIT